MHLNVAQVGDSPGRPGPPSDLLYHNRGVVIPCDFWGLRLIWLWAFQSSRRGDGSNRNPVIQTHCHRGTHTGKAGRYSGGIVP